MSLFAALFFNALGFLTGFKVINHLLVDAYLFAARAFELQELNEFFELAVHLAWHLAISALRAVPTTRLHLTFDAMATEENLALSFIALFRIINDTTAELAQEVSYNFRHWSRSEISFINY